ncbi:MAG: CopM family metallochaperone [Bosea sp. (in: a-proteobacteria)]
MSHLKNRILVAAFAASAMIAGAAFAQQHGGHSNHAGHAGHKAAPANQSTATKAYQAANDKMHKDMAIAFSGNADVDFVKGMIPHHQGAVDMAKVVLAHGKDPELRKLATEIIAAQDKEIAFMQAWLKKNAPK